MPTGSGPSPPRFVPPPKQVGLGQTARGEADRRKRAQDRSGTLLSRGLLTQPQLQFKQLSNALGG